MIATGEARALKMINKTGDPEKDQENYALAQKEASCWAPLKHVNSKIIIIILTLTHSLTHTLSLSLSLSLSPTHTHTLHLSTTV